MNEIIESSPISVYSAMYAYTKLAGELREDKFKVEGEDITNGLVLYPLMVDVAKLGAALRACLDDKSLDDELNEHVNECFNDFANGPVPPLSKYFGGSLPDFLLEILSVEWENEVVRVRKQFLRRFITIAQDITDFSDFMTGNKTGS